MNPSQRPFPTSTITSVATPSEGVWAISVSRRIEPIDPAPLAGGEEEERGWRAWLPALPEGLAGAVFGATIGALIVVAVALDLQDFTPPATAPARTGHFLVNGPGTLEVHGPATAPRRAARDVHEARDARGGRRSR